MELLFEDRAKQVVQGLLDHFVPNGRDAKQSDSTAFFRDFYPSDWLWLVLLSFEFEKKLVKIITQI